MVPFYLNDYTHLDDEDGPSQFDAWVAKIAAEEFPLDEKPGNNNFVSVMSPCDSSSGSSSSASPSPSHPSDGDQSDAGSGSDADSIFLDNKNDANGFLPTHQHDNAYFGSSVQIDHSQRPIVSDAISKPEIIRNKRFIPSNRSISRSSNAVTRAPHFNGTGASGLAVWATTEAVYDNSDKSEGGPSDDEYCPSPPLNPRKRRRGCLLSQSPLPSSTSHSPSSTHSAKRARSSPTSRNKQASSFSAIHRASSIESSSEFDFTCPECGWRQINERMPDFKRHLRTHTRPSEEDQEKGWWCKGVLLKNAVDYQIPEDAQSYTFLNQLRIGGCLRTFSRRDALKRHLDNSNVNCVGRPCGATEE